MILYMESFLFVFIGSFKYAYLLICIFPTTVLLMSLHAPTALKSGRQSTSGKEFHNLSGASSYAHNFEIF